MKRLVVFGIWILAICGCVRSWVGRPVAQLERELGLPRRIRNSGTNQIFVYPDVLAGRGEMTFTVDKDGIIREWYATPDVPGPFDTDVFGDDGFGGPGTNGGLGGNFPQSP